MASVTKLWDATVGYQTGLHGPKRTTLPYQVTVDAVDDNPIDVMKLAGTGVPIGTYHPHDDSLVVVDYIIQDRMNTLNWRVDAIYTIPLHFEQLEPLHNGWALDWQSTTEPYQLYHTLEIDIADRKLIGIPEYRIALKKELPGGSEPAPFIFTTDEEKPKLLVPTGRTVADPVEQAAPVIGFSLTRRFIRLNPHAVSASITYLRKVNVDLFQYVRGDPYTVRFDAIGGRPVPSAAAGTEGGVEWELRLGFTQNPEGFTPVKKFHMWVEEDTGSRAFILDPRGDRQEEEFEVYKLASMNQLMSNFG